MDTTVGGEGTIWFLVGDGTDELLADKEYILSPIETEIERYVHIYLCVSECLGQP